jgi:hypothetical protein
VQRNNAVGWRWLKYQMGWAAEAAVGRQGSNLACLGGHHMSRARRRRQPHHPAPAWCQLGTSSARCPPEPEADVWVLLHEVDEFMGVAAVVHPGTPAGQWAAGSEKTRHQRYGSPGQQALLHCQCGQSAICSHHTNMTPALQPHLFLTCTVCTTFRPLPRMGAWVNTTTGRPAASASACRKKATCSVSTCTSCTLKKLLQAARRRAKRRDY